MNSSLLQHPSNCSLALVHRADVLPHPSISEGAKFGALGGVFCISCGSGEGRTASKLWPQLRNFVVVGEYDPVGINLPTIEVRFEHLNVDAEAYVGDRALPTVSNFFVNIFQGFLNYLHIIPSRKLPLAILQDVSGIIKPARLTLLLGPPSSGKTTLLRALAGELHRDLKVSGNVTYNGCGMNEFVPQRTSAYTSQHDLHIGELTVRETLAFSARCQGVGSRYDIDIFPSVIMYSKILGLEVCADTMVGDQMLRGISGGQKKRVTTGEMLVGPARALFMDEISTGLDTSTTFHIVNSIKNSIHILQGTCVISLLQPAPETYDLFDDIILLSDGHIVYQGPREYVLEFFERMGFKCPDRKGVADFLQEVISSTRMFFEFSRTIRSICYCLG
ncbi:hypothetical protein RHSIM_Rhsim07G0150000 [Rhododendron simsii]|uniref:ABC transporter domain-containing protein n=1 Tax=Rhododendron simsii TaxID=118357 RepID=A0A834GMI4_RHOSS|nr:hypothetical protein RHSIM_Rhsim07G0150000 [Rhododendron simsii]